MEYDLIKQLITSASVISFKADSKITPWTNKPNATKFDVMFGSHGQESGSIEFTLCDSAQKKEIIDILGNRLTS